MIGYETNLLYFWLYSPELAKQRVADRVAKGGHDVPVGVIERRYFRGLVNLFKLYIPIVDNWIIVDNLDIVPDVIAKGSTNKETVILNYRLWDTIINQSKAYGR